MQNISLKALLINAGINLAFTFIGFGLGFIAFIIQEKIKRNIAHGELMRSLLMEVQTNRTRCEEIINNNPATAFLETACWDRIRYSDCLYFCITSRDASLYRQLLHIYNTIITLNLGIARYFSALDSNTRFPTQDNMSMVNTTLNNLRAVIPVILPTIRTLEDSLTSFLTREGFFK